MADTRAWAAGLFEGEGCFNVTQRPSGKVQVQARLAMTDRDIVERFAQVVGVGTVTDGRKRRPNEKRIYEWYVNEATKVIAVIDMLLPWLGERRKAKALEVRDAARTIQPHNRKRTHCPKGHPYDEENLKLEPIVRDGRKYFARRCLICRREQSRERARKRLGITPDRFRLT